MISRANVSPCSGSVPAGCRRALVRRFRYLDETIALVLAFVGFNILVSAFVEIGDLASLAVIGAFLAGGIAASLVADRLDPPHPAEEATRRPPRCPRQLARRAAPTNAELSS